MEPTRKNIWLKKSQTEMARWFTSIRPILFRFTVQQLLRLCRSSCGELSILGLLRPINPESVRSMEPWLEPIGLVRLERPTPTAICGWCFLLQRWLWEAGLVMMIIALWRRWLVIIIMPPTWPIWQMLSIRQIQMPGVLVISSLLIQVWLSLMCSSPQGKSQVQ